MLVLCYPNCSTCKKAEKWLERQGMTFESRDIKKNNPTQEELGLWYQKSGLPLKRFWNTSGQGYKALNLKEKLPTLSEQEQLALLASDGMLVKRPILIHKDGVLVGFKEAEWEGLLVRKNYVSNSFKKGQYK